MIYTAGTLRMERQLARMGLSLAAHRKGRAFSLLEHATGMLGLSCSQVCEPASQQAIPSPADKRTCPGRQSLPVSGVFSYAPFHIAARKPPLLEEAASASLGTNHSLLEFGARTLIGPLSRGPSEIPRPPAPC